LGSATAVDGVSGSEGVLFRRIRNKYSHATVYPPLVACEKRSRNQDYQTRYSWWRDGSHRQQAKVERSHLLRIKIRALVTTGLPELPPTLSGLILGLFCHFHLVFNTLEL
jgi:hypothetical protein